MNYRIDRMAPSHMPQLVALSAQHAAFEKTQYNPFGKADALSAALFSDSPRLHGWVAVSDVSLIGYATASAEYSTWSACEYLHMDCLFVVAGHRNEGIGRALFASVMAFSRDRGYRQVQWQTPHWNVDARRFYHRQGAVELEKSRFFLDTAFGEAAGS